MFTLKFEKFLLTILFGFSKFYLRLIVIKILSNKFVKIIVK